MIDGGGISLRDGVTEMKYSLRILTFEIYKSLSDKCIYFGYSRVWQHPADCLKQKEQCN